MKLSSWAIRRPIPTIVLFLLLSVLGAVSFQRLPVNANPNVGFPIINISISRSGAAPEELENAVTRRVESAVAGMAGVRHITSEITDGLSTTTVEFQLHIDTDRAVNDVRNAVGQIRADLPASIDEPLIERVDVEGGALAYYAVESPDMDTAALSWFVDDTVSRRLLAVPGVQQITRSGGSQREITVALRPERLEALGISITRVNAQLVQTSVDVPGGRLSADGGESSLRVPGSAAGVPALAATPIALGDGRRVTLGDIADITDGHGEIRSRTRLNGREVVGFSLYRSKGTSDTAVADGVEQAIATLQAENPHIRIRQVHSSVDATRENYHTAIDTLLEGAVLTVLVVFLFLRDWRATLVAAIALPLSILPAFLVMQLSGYTLNSVTLLGLTLVIGILVDDAIVEIENIDKHLMLGKRPYRAAIDAADAIGFAVIAITGTIVAVFLPVSFTGGMIGQYFSQFGTTVSAAVLASLLTARLATPLLAAYLLAPASGAQRHKPQSRPMRAYLALLAWTLRHRKTTLGLAALILAASFLLLPLLPLLPTGFMPRADTGFSQLNIDLPPGSTLADTDATLRRLSDSANRHPAVARTYATAGRGGDVAKGELLIRLRPYKERSVGLRTFEQQLRDTLAQEPDIRFAFQNDAAQRDISIILTGNDPATLSATARTLKNQMQSIAGITNIQTNEPLPKNEQRLRLNAQEAARLGITPQAVGDLLRLATLGSSNSESARYNTHGRQITIRTILSADARNDAAQLQHLRVPAADGTNVPLHTIAGLHPASGSATISRFDHERRISVEADLKNGYTIGTIIDAVNRLPVMQPLPPGIHNPEYGDSEYMNEMFEQFGLAMGFGVLMVYLVLVLLFRDILQPVTILTALPLSLGGALGALLAYGAALDLSSVIGILMLMSIVTKNSILLVDFVIENRRHGMARATAIVQAGAERARPIIMTTIAMVAGMVPAVLAGGSGAAFRAPMAVAVIGGLLTSTALSLIFVPVTYSVLDDLRRWLAPRLARLTSVTAAERAAAEAAEGQPPSGVNSGLREA